MRMLVLCVLSAAFLALLDARGVAGATESLWPDGSEAPTVTVADTAAAVAEPRCDEFRHVQTYRNWGPARHFDRMVTVEYRATQCAVPVETAVNLNMEGTATVHDGDSTSHAVLGTRPFVVMGTWEQAANPMGWPPSWWQCGVSFAQYRWEISGVYSFDVSATGGTWTLVVDVAGTPAGDLTWAYDACST